MGIESGAPRRRLGIDDLLGAGKEIVPSRGRRVRQTRLGCQAGMPSRADHVQKERPAVQLAVDRALLPDRWNYVVDHIFRNVVIPGFGNIGLDERRHFDEWRLADIDVPCALLVLGLGDEALDPEAFDRGDLVVDSRELGVYRCNAGMQVLDPLIECGRKRTVRGKGAPNAGLRHCSDAGHTEARNQAAGDELASVDAPLGKFAAVPLPQQVFLFAQSTHLFPNGQCLWDIVSTTELPDGHSWIGIYVRTPGLVAVDAQRRGESKSPAVGFRQAPILP